MVPTRIYHPLRPLAQSSLEMGATRGFLRLATKTASAKGATSEHLRALPFALRLAAIAAALPYADEAEVARLSAMLAKAAVSRSESARHSGSLMGQLRGAIGRLLKSGERRERAEEDARIEVARLWRYLSADARAEIVSAREICWRVPVRVALADADPQVRVGGVELSRAVGDAALLGVLLPLLSDGDSRVAEAAEGAYVGAATAAVRAPGVRAEVERHVAEGLAEYDRHKRRGLLRAAIALADGAFLARVGAGRGGRLAEVLLDSEQAFQFALRSYVRRSDDPLVRERCWVWLGRGFGGRAAAERLAVAASSAEHEAVLRNIHLLENPRRWAALRGVKGGEGASWVPGPTTVVHLGVASRRALPRWLGAIDIGADARRAALEPLLVDPDAGVRLAGAWAAGPKVLPDFCFDRDERVACAAVRRWSDAGLEFRRARGVDEQRRQAVTALCRHPSMEVRRLAGQEAERIEPWDARSVSSRLAARRRLVESPARFAGEVRQRLASESDRMSALLVIRALGLHRQFEADLLALVQGTTADERVAATAVAILGDLDSDAARLAVDRHRHHASPRVRANAVEAVARAARTAAPGDRRADALVEHKGDENHRVRANAIRGLFFRGRLFGEGHLQAVEEPVAADSLAGMLCDERPMHRLAGVWLADRILCGGSVRSRRWADLAGRVADMAESDPDDAARARAGRASARLLAGVRDGWRQRAVSVGEAVLEGVA
jgi:hypothetical protein